MHQRLRPEEKLQVHAGNAGRLDEVGLGELFGEFLAEFLGVLFDAEGWDLYLLLAFHASVYQYPPM